MLLGMEDGSRVPLAAVRKFGPEDQLGFHAVYGADGELLGRCHQSVVERAEQALLPMVPAQPGWLVVAYTSADDEEFGHDTEPVIGWLVDEFCPVPITPSGMTLGDSSIPYFVLAPAESGASLLGYDSFGAYHDMASGLRHAEETWRKARAAREKVA